MPATTTAGDFLDILRRSGLIEPAALADYLARFDVAADPSPTELAARMLRDGLVTPFQANHLLKGRYKNFFIGKYKVLAPLGRGGMSQVFLCEHTFMRHRVALKLLPLKESADPAAVSRFLREARAAASVNHPNVVRAHDFDKAEDKFFYLVMDYVDGVNLHDLVKKIGVLPPAHAAQYIAQAAIGVQEIADRGLIHRDLKPGNLLLDRDGVIRILDLGLARFTDSSIDNLTRELKSDTIFGTADYLAPEQALHDDAIDSRADLYSLGATFYYLLSGRAPFEASGTAQKLLAHQFRDPEPIPGVPAGAMDVLLKMMKKKPDDRYQSAYEVAEALAPYLGEPLPPPDESCFPPRGLGISGPRTAAPSTAGLGKTVPSGRTTLRGPTSDILKVGPRSGIHRGATGRLSGIAPAAAAAKLPWWLGWALAAGIGLAVAIGVMLGMMWGS